MADSIVEMFIEVSCHINIKFNPTTHTANTNPTDTAAGSLRMIGLEMWWLIVSAITMLRRSTGELSSGGGDL